MEKLRKIWRGIGICAFILTILLAFVGCSDIFELYTDEYEDEDDEGEYEYHSSFSDDYYAAKNELEPVSEPRSGEILSGTEVYYESEIEVTAPYSESCVVKLKTRSGITRLSFYVRAGDTVTVGVPAEKLYVYFACGKTWYGADNLFGKNTSYSMDDELADFSEYTWEYTLTPVSGGNFSETPIDEEEFMD